MQLLIFLIYFVEEMAVILSAIKKVYIKYIYIKDTVLPLELLGQSFYYNVPKIPRK